MALERLDTLIAFAVLMAGISMMITLLNQMVASLLAHRGAYLRDGIIDLLTTLDPTLKDKARRLVTSALTHPLVSDSVFARIPFAPTRWRLATAVRSEELSKLLKLCSDPTELPKIELILNQVNPEITRETQLIAAVANSLGAPAATADRLIQQVSDKATNAIGRFDAAFHSTMDRVSQRFTLQMRMWTIVFSIGIACIYHTDAFVLYSQISTEPALRQALVAASDDIMKKSADLAAQTNADETAKQLAQSYQAMQKELSPANSHLVQIPSRWYCWSKKEIPGIAVTAAFLSLGAPFWYNILKGLTSLRPLVAKKQAEEASPTSK
jgi:hypothetical protein